MKKATKWILGVFASVAVLVAVLAGVAFAIDPYHQFRSDGSSKWEDVRFNSPGLTMNHDYNAIIIGSSMAQNFHMDRFREELGVEPLKVAIGGMGPELTGDFLDLAYRSNKASEFFSSIDLQIFATVGDQMGENAVPEYLMTGLPLDRLRYLLSYEVWFKFIPLDIVIGAAEVFGISLPDSYVLQTDIDSMGDWSRGTAFGEDVVLSKWANNIDSVSKVDTAGLESRMRANVDAFASSIDATKGNHTFFFPPYSALYWCDAQEKGYFETYMRAKARLINKLKEKGVEVFDFQAADFVVDLNNYRDTTHYSPDINDWMVDCFASGEYRVEGYVDAESLKAALVVRTDEFRDTHSSLF